MYSFGSGVLLGQRTDIANATPINFGLIQEVSLDLGFDTKMLYGQNQFPVAIARGKGKVTGKAKMAKISGIAFASLFFGLTLSAGQLATAFGEGPSAVPASPFQITVVNGATWVDDYGVVNAATGLPLQRVASGPVAGQYAVAAGGIYTFSSADHTSGVAVLISYTYTVSGSGQQLTLPNNLLGTTPTFQAQLYTTFQGLPLNVKLLNCVSGKLALATKLDDFVIPELDFDCFANAAGNVLQMSFAEAS